MCLAEEFRHLERDAGRIEVRPTWLGGFAIRRFEERSLLFSLCDGRGYLFIKLFAQ